MTATFELPEELIAHEPPPVRDGVRLLVAGPDGFGHHVFRDLPALLRPGDLLVVNTSATLPAAVPTYDGLTVHFSTRAADGRWLVEIRLPDGPYRDAVVGQRFALRGGATVTLVSPYSEGRLWVASVSAADVVGYLHRHGRPIRYGYVRAEWPLSEYQTVFAGDTAGSASATASGSASGSAEMPSAGRPFTDRVVTRLVCAGVQIAPMVLHTGVASAEAHERPYPEWFSIPAATARAVAHTRADGGRVIAIGTTVVRALETTGGDAGEGWTHLVVTPERGVRVVDGLLTGFHEPRASHLDLLAAVAGPERVAATYEVALAAGYRWHEFGDVNLILRG